MALGVFQEVLCKQIIPILEETSWEQALKRPALTSDQEARPVDHAYSLGGGLAGNPCWRAECKQIWHHDALEVGAPNPRTQALL